jgi:hypothetical protein
MSMFGSFLQWIGLVGGRKAPAAQGLDKGIKDRAGEYDRPVRFRRKQYRGGAWLRKYRAKRKIRNRIASESRRINRKEG